MFVRDGPFDDQDEIVHLSRGGLMEGPHEVVAIRQGKKGIVQRHFRNPGNLPEKDIFDAGLSGRGHGDSVPITAQARGNPEDIELGHRILN